MPVLPPPRAVELWKDYIIILIPLALARFWGKKHQRGCAQCLGECWEKVVSAEGLGEASLALGKQTAPGQQDLPEIQGWNAAASCADPGAGSMEP